MATSKDMFMVRDAVISDCAQYRYLLRRAWDHAKPRALFIMFNPSTADADVDDATIRSCIRLCRGWEYGSFEVINLFAFRSTDASKVPMADDPIGPDNHKISEAAIARCDMPICAWGKFTFGQARSKIVHEMIRSHRPAAFCLGTNGDGSPKHPLYIKTGTPLVAYTA